MIKHPTTQAITLMLISMAGFAMMNIMISILAPSIHSMQMVFIRNLFSLVMVVVLVAGQQRGRPRFSTQRLFGHFGRAAFGLTAMQLWFYSVTIMPVTLATALSFTTPIFATIFAILFLGEQAGIRRWSAMVASFIGVLLIINPDSSGFDSKTLFVLAASAMMAVAGVFVKNLSSTESAETIVFYMALFMLPLSTPLGIWHWQSLTGEQWGLLFAIAFVSTAAQLMMARAFKRAEMVVLLPFDFTRLLFTSVFAYFLFDEVLDQHAWLGACIIMSSTLYIAYREAKMKRQNKLLINRPKLGL